MMTRPGIGDLLRRAGEARQDGLRPETRRRLIRMGLETVREPASPSWRGALPALATAGAALAAAGLLIGLPMLVPQVGVPSVPPGTAGDPALTADAAPAAQTPVKDLTVVADGDRVVLNWTDGGAPRKVFRATSHAELSNIKVLPARTVAGETWIDEEQSTAPIVYYVIE